MDYSVGPDDTTTVIKMVKSLKDFLDKSPEPKSYQDQYDFSFDSNCSNSSLASAPPFYSDKFTNPSSVRKRSLLTIKGDNKAEMLYTKSKVSRLQNDIKTLETEKKIMELEQEKFRKTEVQKRSKDLQECESLRKTLQDLNSQKKDTEEELLDYKNKYESLKINFDVLKSKYALERDKLEAQLNESRVRNSEHKSDVKQKCNRLERELSEKSLALKEAETHLKRFRDRQREHGNIMLEHTDLEYRCNQAEQRAKVLEDKLSKIDESALFMQKCQTELANYRKLEKENSKLKEDNLLYRQSEENALKLQEIINMKTAKLEKAEEQLKHYHEMEFENQMLHAKIEKWESKELYGDGNIPRSPLELTRMIAELQKSQLLMAEKHGELEASVFVQQSTLDEKTTELEKINCHNSTLLEENKKLEDHCQKLQRRYTLVSTERDGLRRVLSSYEKEEGKDAGNQNEQNQEIINQYLNQIHQLELQLSEARQEGAVQKTDYMKLQLEYEQLKSTSMITDTSVSNMAATQLQEIETLKKQVTELKEENKKAIEDREKYKCLFDERMLQGGFNRLTTKPNYLLDNPLHLKHKKFLEEAAAVQEENKKLKAKILKLKQQQNDQMDETMNLSKIIRSSKPMEDAVKQVQAEQLKTKRLKEHFSEKIRNFRAALVEILGFNMTSEGENKYIVRSSFSESRDDFFAFNISQSEDEANTKSELLDTEYVREWMSTDEFTEYVEEGDSIPAFLAAVNLKLFKDAKLDTTKITSS